MPEPLRVVLVTRTFVIDDKRRSLLIKRVSSDRHNPDLWECPGGKVDKGENLQEARMREVLDETGLIVRPVSPFSHVDDHMITMGQYGEIPSIRIFSVMQVAGGELKLKKDEHDDSAWVSYLDMFSFSLTSEVRAAAQKFKEYLWW